jgi:cytochrome c oxidase cbb3-type subunit 1
MYKSADPALYPPVNPDSGGATGGSLLGSSLAIVLIYWITPMVLDLPTSKPWRSFMPSLFFLMVHTGAFLMLDHGDHSHHETVQIAALASLVIWVPVLVRHLRKFSWPEGSRMWLIAFAAWALFLLVSGLFTFMPGILDRWKFTNALVAHSHIAMAGMISSFNMIVLTVLSRGTIAEGVFEAVLPFGLWQSGDIIQSAALLTAGTLESAHPDWLFTGHVAMRALYAARLAGGVLMLAASAYWLYATHLMKEDETT